MTVYVVVVDCIQPAHLTYEMKGYVVLYRNAPKVDARKAIVS